MADLYPYAPWGQDQSSVYFPSNIHRERLVNDAAYTLMVLFLPGSVDRDCTRIQHHLTSLYGGLPHHFRTTRCSRVRFLIALPEHLNRGMVLGALTPWANNNNVAFSLYDYTQPWKPTPISFRVYLRVSSYPTEFWHHSYFSLLTAGFGEVLYADQANTLGRDRSTLRLTIRAFDPSLIPSTMIVHCQNGWTRCRLAIIGWEADESDLPADFQGPASGGSMEEVDPDSETWHGLSGEDATARHLLLNAHRETMRQQPEHNTWWRSNATMAMTRPIAEAAAPGSAKSQLKTKRGAVKGGNPEDDSGDRSCTDSPSEHVPKPMQACLDHIWQNLKGKIKCMVWRYPKRRIKTNFSQNQLHKTVTTFQNLLREFQISLPLTPSAPLMTLMTPAHVPLCKQQPLTPEQTAKPGIIPSANQAQPPHTQLLSTHANPLKDKPIIPSQESAQTANHKSISPKSSILGPPPATHKNFTTILSKNYLHILPLSKRSKCNMDQSDEDLIRKFADLQTETNSSSSTISIPTQAINVRNWELCALVKVFSDRPVFDSQFERQMRRAWGVCPRTSFTMSGRGIYLVECENKKDFDRIISEGPWSYRQDLVVAVECASPDEIDGDRVTHAELWVQFHNLGLEVLTEEGVRILTEPVGTVLSEPMVGYLNGKTFFKVKLLLSLGTPVKDKLKITNPILGNVEVFLVYEKIGRICCFCGAVGHEISSCQDRARLAKIKSRMGSQCRPELEGILKPTRGPWLVNNTLIPLDDNAESPKVIPRPANTPKSATVGLKRTLTEINPLYSDNGSGMTYLITDPSSQPIPTFNQTQNDEKDDTVPLRRFKAARPSAQTGAPLDQK